jgi:hypothetical protein
MEDGPMPKKDSKDTGGSTAPKQPDREQVQEWEDEGGATKPSAQQAQSASPAKRSEKSRSRTGR